MSTAVQEKVPHRHEVQTTLDLREQIDRPLVKVDMVAAFLRRTEDNIVQTLIPNGLLAWAFDIARKPNSSRREIRILSESVDAYKSGILPQEGWRISHAGGVKDWQRVITLILPSRQSIRSFELAHWFFCDKSHISHLLKDGTLKTSRAAVGCKSAVIERASIVEFLKARRITS